MKRNRAKAILNKTAEVINDINRTRDKVRDVANNLLGDGEMDLENIKVLAHLIANEQGYQETQLVVCDDIIELQEHLSHKDVSLLEKEVFVIHPTKTNFITFCIVKLDDKIICLYKDFYDTHVLATVNDILGQRFGANIDYKIHAEIEIIEKHENIGILALELLKTMMIYLKKDERMNYIQCFASRKGSFLGRLKKGSVNLKNGLFQKVKYVYYETLFSDINQLSGDVEFRKAIKKFTDSIPSIEEADNVKNYQALLKKFVDIEIDGSNIDTKEMTELLGKLEHARKAVFEKTSQIKIETSENKEGNIELDIVKNFPEQMEKFTNIFKPLMSSEVDDNLEKVLKDISDKLELDYNKVRSFFKIKEETKPDETSTQSIEDIENLINDLPVLEAEDVNFINTNKPIDQLLLEVIGIDVNSLKQDYDKVKSSHESWSNKKAKQIDEWAANKKGKLEHSEVYEAVAVMDKANEIATGGHKLRDTQILSVLAFLQQKDKGLLAQIETGEGKTTIVSILAAIFALQGRRVDVITSNPVLASEVVKDKHIFNRLLNLTVCTNNLDENYKSGARKCYEADIVYGSINNFQFDYLKDSFLCLNTRGGRPFDKIILDEVDSMIIDNASHIAKLSNPLPGMESLEYVYINIWQALYKAEANIVQELQEELKLKAQEVSVNDRAQLLFEFCSDQLQNSISQRIKDYISSSNPTKIDIIPSHIQEYADKSLERWINSAIDAKFCYEQDVQYVIGYQNGEEVVQPVDYSNTGITLKNTMWQYGLHQFLQLKHNVHVTSESLTSCFISNLGYINKYGGAIFGVTGTLGSEAERDLLSSVYNVEYLKIPTFKEKKFKEIYGEVVDQEIFCEQVADNAISTINRARSALIICETIKEAKTIREALERKQENIAIRTFFNEDNANITEKEVDIREVIIATNIAGRGTDLKTSPRLDNNGGLKVFVAFLPCNKRVQDQAFGRTARQGNKGTAKLIIKKNEVTELGIDTDDFEEIKRLRDRREEERIQHIREVKVSEIMFQDKLFELFSTLYRKLKNKCQSEEYYQYALDDLKEFWAFWLEKSDFQGLTLVDRSPEDEFELFEKEASDIINGKIKFNPYYSIQQAECFILNDKLDRAESALNHAISISKNPEILNSAYMKLFDIAIQKGEVFMNKCRKAIGDIIPIPMLEPDTNYKQNAKKYLEQAKKADEKELDYIKNILGAEEFINIINNDSAEFSKSDCSYWFSDEDMHNVGKKIIYPLVENIDTQFINRLTGDQIDTFCKEYQLKEHLPVFICYNVGGKTSENSGYHWVGMCILKIAGVITLFYKDPKGDFSNNLEVVENQFQKNYKNLNVIAHRRSEQNDDSSCGPMTLENLRIMANWIKENGVEHFVENFTKLKFSQQEDVIRLRNEFTLPSEAKMKENIFIKHIVSRQLALTLNMNQAQSLVAQIDQHNAGIALGGRVPDYFSKIKPQNDNETKIKDTIADSELSELARVGGNIIYALKEVHDVCPEIVKGARIQIASGIALSITGCLFPPAIPVTSAISGTMITEGICDISFDLINRNSDGQFNKAAYVKGKVISYGISLLTMGINAALQCPKILSAAKNACRWLTTTLRKCPYWKKACEYLASTFDKIHDWFDKMETIAKFSQMSKVEKLKYFEDLEKVKDLKKLNYLGNKLKEIQMLKTELQQVGRLTETTHFQKCVSSLQQLGMGTAEKITKRSVENVIMNKVVIPSLSSLVSELKPKIKKHVEKSLRKNIDMGKLRCSTISEIQSIIKHIKESIDCKTMRDILKDAILGITKQFSDWRVQLGSLALDQYCCWIKLYDYVEDLCKIINSKLNSSGDFKNQDTERLVDQLIEQLSEDIFAQVVDAITKTCIDVYSVGKSAYRNYKKNKQEETKCLGINEGFRKGGPASQEHARALSDVIKRPLHIYEQNGNVVILGEQYLGDPIKLKYLPPDESNQTGHYVPHGEAENWSSDTGNNCLFDSVASQIGEDPRKLREETRKHIESDPTRYIAHHLHVSFDIDVFLEGGKKGERRRKCKLIDGDYYPSYLNRIKVIPREKCEKIFHQIAEKLNEYKTREERYSEKGDGEKLRQMRINKNMPQFTSTEKKEEMMMGIMIIHFTNGEGLKLMTVSGDDRFSTTASLSHDMESNFTKTSIPGKLKIQNSKFQFVNIGEPEGNVWDVYNKCDTTTPYTRCCAAQKLFYHLSETMKNNPALKIKGEIQMSECYYVPHKDKYRNNPIIEGSCAKCQTILPVATGKNKSDYHK